MIMHHHRSNGHPARQMYLVPTYCWIFFLGDSHCVGSDVAYDLIPESYLGCLGLVECPDPQPLQPALPQLPSASVALFSFSVSPGHSLSPESIDRWDIPSPHVRHLGVKPRSYRQRSFTSWQASWCWTTILQTAKIEWNRNRFSFHWVSPVWTSLLLFTLTKNLLFVVPSFAWPIKLT